MFFYRLIINCGMLEQFFSSLTGGARLTRKSARKSARKSTRKSARKSAHKSTRKSVRKSARKSVRKSARKSTSRRYHAYVISGLDFKPILARKEVVDDIVKNKKKLGYTVKTTPVKLTDRLKTRKWVYY